MTRPGIYLRGEIEYDKIDAINYSTLKWMAKSPLHYQNVLKSGVTENDAMGKGTAAHLALLEPELFGSGLAVWHTDRGQRRGNDWKLFEADAKAAGKKTIREADLADVLWIRDAVLRHELAASYFTNGHSEVSMVWRDEETGLFCKCRVDYLRRDNTITDLKTTGDVEPSAFGRTCARMMYHVQSAFYSDALHALTHKPVRFAIVAVEQKAPHDVVPYPASEDSVIGPGRKEYRRLLARVKECRETGHWPGMANGQEMALNIPIWTPDGEDELELTIDGEAFSY